MAGASRAPGGGGVKVKAHNVYQTACNIAPGDVAGSITEFTVPTAASSPWGIASDRNGKLYVSEYAKAAVDQFDVATGAFTARYTLKGTAPIHPENVAVNLNGNVYVNTAMELEENWIDPSTGTVTKNPAGGSRLPPDGIDTVEVGNNAGIWLTIPTTQNLYHISPTGAITNPFISGTGYVRSLTGDSNGNVWITMTNNTIVQMTPSGAKTRYTVPITNVQGVQTTEGPSNDGVWLPQQTQNEIANVSQTGAVSEFPIPTASAKPYGIVSTCGVVVFAEFNANKIGMLDPSSGQITEYNVPTAGSEPFEMTVDNNGYVWFTEYAANKIARLVPASGSPPTPQPNGKMYILPGTTVNGQNQIIAYGPASYQSPANTVIRSLPNGTGNDYGKMTFDAGGNLWAAYSVSPGGQPNTYYQIVEYAPGASGNTPPATVITPTDTYTQMSGIALDGSGNIYVLDGGQGKIFVYPAGSSGSVGATQIIQDASELTGGNKLGFDRHGNLWAVSTNGLLEYHATDNGPTSAFNVLYNQQDAQTCLGYPYNAWSFAFDTNGDIIASLNVIGTPGVANLIGFPDGAHAGDCPSLKGQLAVTVNGAQSGVTYDVSVDDNGYIYGIDNSYNAAVYRLSDVWAAYPSSDANPVSFIHADPDMSNNIVAVATWTGTGWLYGNSRHKHKPVRKPHR